MTRVSRDELASFLVEAKRATYAGQGDEASVEPLLPGTKQLEHRSGRYLYRDIYVGMERFVGQEIVYSDAVPVWAMAYAGGIIRGDLDEAGSVYACPPQARGVSHRAAARRARDR